MACPPAPVPPRSARRRLLRGVLAASVLGPVRPAAAQRPTGPAVELLLPTRDPVLPMLADAREAAPLGRAAWLSLELNALRLLDARGREQALMPIRGAHLDTRATAHGAIAVVFDVDTRAVVRVAIDTGYMRMESLVALADVPLDPVAAMCLWRDAGQAEHLIVLDDRGAGRHWRLRPGQPAQAVRALAVAPGPRGCRVDEAARRLLVTHAGLGVMAYDIDGAGPGDGIALPTPLDRGRPAIGCAALSDGLLLLGANGFGHLLARAPAGGYDDPRRVFALPPGFAPPRAFAVREDDESGGVGLFWRPDAEGWRKTLIRRR